MISVIVLDRGNIEKIAHTAEDRLLLAKVFDKISAGVRRNVMASTAFLAPRELEMCRYLFGDEPGLVCFGGYDEAERKMLVYLPEYLDETFLTDDNSPVVCLRAEFYEGDSPTHRDFLGALMGAGIRREAVGDICISENSCDLLVTAQIAEFVLQNLSSAGRAKLRISRMPLTELKLPQPEIREIKDTLASLRLDSVVSSGFRIGRSLASQHIHAGKVAIDGLPCEKPDKIVPEGVKISLRGAGKIKLVSASGLTKKSRIPVVIHRYM